MIIWIARFTTAPRVHERAQSTGPPIASAHSPTAETRHCYALSWFAVSRNESRYRLYISSLKVLKKSVIVGYGVALSLAKCTVAAAYFASLVSSYGLL